LLAKIRSLFQNSANHCSKANVTLLALSQSRRDLKYSCKRFSILSQDDAFPPSAPIDSNPSSHFSRSVNADFSRQTLTSQDQSKPHFSRPAHNSPLKTSLNLTSAKHSPQETTHSSLLNPFQDQSNPPFSSLLVKHTLIKTIQTITDQD